MMKLSFLSSLFQAKEDTSVVLDSLLVQKIKSLSKNSNLIVFSHKEIFHHKSAYPISLIIYDDMRGLYIFEIKTWSFDALKDATASKAKSVQNAQDTLAFDNTHAIIKQKFNELLHNDGVDIFNYLLMENLRSDEYDDLNESLKELLPKERIIFSDSESSDIFKKLQDATAAKQSLPSADTVFGTLFIQYSIAQNNKEIYLCNSEQIAFIDAKIKRTQNLTAPAKSGKSYALLLKSMKELFKKEREKIILIKPTILSKDILHQRFLELIEHAIIDIDLMAFEILTPIELLNRHLAKLKMPALDEMLFIDEKLMHRSFNAGDLILCDDADLLPENFLDYLKHIQKKSDLLLVNDTMQQHDFSFIKSYLPKELKIGFYETNPHAKGLHLIATLLQKVKAKDILVVSNRVNREKLNDDLTDFIEERVSILDANRHLVEQQLDSLCLATYSDIVEMEAKHVILMDLCSAEDAKLLYACNIATEGLHILYEQASPVIEKLKEKYESS